MAHFAKIGLNSKVIAVETVNDSVLQDSNGVEQEQLGIDFLTNLTGWAIWKQTSFNTRGGKYYNEDGTEHADQSKAFRKNFAGIGMTYDEDKDAFIFQKPVGEGSYILDETTGFWKRPLAFPTDFDNNYVWDEDAYQADNTTGWVSKANDNGS